MTPAELEAMGLRAFQSLTPQERMQVIRGLSSKGMSEASISHMTGLSVEQVRLWRGEPDRQANGK